MKHLNPYFLFLGTAGCLLLAAGLGLCFFAAAKNLLLGAVMLLARFVPMIATLAIAGNLAGKKRLAATAGTLSTTNALFVFLLILIVLLIGALSFFPALALGPLAEFFGAVL